MELYSYNNFVRAIDLETTPVDKKEPDRKVKSVDGTAVKDFYENLVGLSGTRVSQETPVASSSSVVSGSLSKPSKSGKKVTPRKCEDEAPIGVASVKNLLQGAQDGDVKKVKDCVRAGVDINAQDPFGWTALMCATQEGHVEVVKYLLWQECNMFICDNKGRGALDLAKIKKNRELVDILAGHMNGITYKEKAVCEKKSASKYPKFFCEVCKKYFEDCSRESHTTSTVHLFNKKLPTKSNGFLIPESNRGFQMLVKSGWDKDAGLGNEGQGQKFPVKTVLKRDRKGLGLDEKAKSKARITHFQPHDESAIKRVRNPSIRKEKVSTRSKKANAKKLSKEREFEKQYCMEFHMSSLL